MSYYKKRRATLYNGEKIAEDHFEISLRSNIDIKRKLVEMYKNRAKRITIQANSDKN